MRRDRCRYIGAKGWGKKEKEKKLFSGRKSSKGKSGVELPSLDSS